MLNRNHYSTTINNYNQPRVQHVHAMLSTNAIEGITGNEQEGITTKVRITQQPIPQKCIITDTRLHETKSPPFADATDADDNSDEYEERIPERIPVFDSTNPCSNQRTFSVPLQLNYCSSECYKAAESGTRYNIS